MEGSLQKRACELVGEYRGVKKVALSYSGGLDSAVVGALLSRCGLEILPVAVDLGQKSDFAKIRKNSEKLFGSFVFIDAKEEFADSIHRLLKANFESRNDGGVSRPVIAHALSKAAREHGCQAIAHGSSGVGNEHLIMENSLRVLAPEMRIMAPVRDLDMRRDESVSFAVAERLPVNMKRASSFSADENLWVRTMRQGLLAESGKRLPEDLYKWTVSPEKAPSKPSDIVVEFKDGIPMGVVIDGKKTTGNVNVIGALNRIGGNHGVGREEGMDEKAAGLKIHEAYERPAAAILLKAHKRLEELTLTTKELDAKKQIEAIWGRLVHDGGWHTRLRRCLDSYIDCASHPVEGKVSVRLYKGCASVGMVESRHALYDKRLSGRDRKGVFSQKEARHFAKLYGLQDTIAYLMDAD